MITNIIYLDLITIMSSQLSTYLTDSFSGRNLFLETKRYTHHENANTFLYFRNFLDYRSIKSRKKTK